VRQRLSGVTASTIGTLPYRPKLQRRLEFRGRFIYQILGIAYRVRYVALTRVGTFIEGLAKNRPDLDALATMAEITATTPVAMPTLPREWLDENEVASAEIDVPHDNGLVDIATGEGMASLNSSDIHEAYRNMFLALESLLSPDSPNEDDK
jgi:hypothetical protein